MNTEENFSAPCQKSKVLERNRNHPICNQSELYSKHNLKKKDYNMNGVKENNSKTCESLPIILKDYCKLNGGHNKENSENNKLSYCANGTRSDFTSPSDQCISLEDNTQTLHKINRNIINSSGHQHSLSKMFSSPSGVNGVNGHDILHRPISESETLTEVKHQNGFKETCEIDGVHKDGGWLRPASESELFMEMCHQNGFMLTAYQLSLTSREPIHEECVKKALTHLYRQVPSLRMTLRQRDKGVWWHYMDEEIIDFKVVDGSSTSQEFESLKIYQYDVRKGPLWCARLSVPSAAEHSNNTNQNHLLFGFHHAISDGPSSVKICSFFIDILNLVIQGPNFDTNVQLAEFVSDHQTKKLIELKLSDDINSKNIINSSSISERIETYIKNKRNVPLLISAFPVTEIVKPRTLTITKLLDKVTTSKLKSKCKCKGVTLHTGFVSIANAAIVQLLQESGMSQESYDINAYHTVNMRRYWDGDVSKAFGNHLGVLNIRTETPKNVEDKLWEYAQSLHKEFYLLLNDRAPLEELILRRLCFMKLGINPSEMLKSDAGGPKPHSYYGTTNLGDLDHILLSQQDHVQVTELHRSTSIHALGNTMTHVLHTYQGRLTLALDYVNTYMTQDTANRYMDLITNIIKNNV